MVQYEGKVQALTHSIPELSNLMTVDRVVGEGTYSTVYLATLAPHLPKPGRNDKVAIKHITQLVTPSLQANELRCLTMLGGKCNVIKLLFAVRRQDSLALVMPYLEHDKFNRIVKRFTCDDTKDYLKKLLTALRHLHSHNIIHRDVKPNNFLYNSKTKECSLVDFGLAQVGGETGEMLRDKESFSVGLSGSSAAVPFNDRTNNVLNIPGNASTSTDAKPPHPSASSKHQCGCAATNKVCRKCLALPMVNATRSGTAGYRPPEVRFLPKLKCMFSLLNSPLHKLL